MDRPDPVVTLRQMRSAITSPAAVEGSLAWSHEALGPVVEARPIRLRAPWSKCHRLVGKTVSATACGRSSTTTLGEWSHAAADRDGCRVPVRRDASGAHGGRRHLDLRPVDGARRPGDVQGDPRPHRQAPPRGAGVPPAAGAGAARPRSPVLDRGPRLRPRVPRPPHRAAGAGRLAPAVHPGGPPGVAAARPRAAAVGAVRHRGPRQRRGRPAGQLRARHQGPPRGDRRHVRDGDDERHPRRQPDGRAVSLAGHVASGDGAEHGRAAVAGGPQQRGPPDARRPGDGPGRAAARPAAAPDPDGGRSRRRRRRSRAPAGAAR